MVLLATGGLTIGLAGIPVRLVSGHSGLVHIGASLIRSIEHLTPIRGGTFVYFIQDGQAATKIGISGDPAQRVASLQTGHPEPLHLWKTIRCRSSADARAVERDLHMYFERQRMNGEWFDLTERQMRRAVKLARRWR